MKDLEEKILKLAIGIGYKEKGIDVFYDVIKSKEEAKKEQMKENDYNDIKFELGYIYTKLTCIGILISLKDTEKNKENRKKIADILIEVSEELRNIKDVD